MATDQEKYSQTFVFLGPSLPLAEAREILPATYLGPVAQGDVAGILWQNPKNIIIIDGYFNRVPAVWHKEILLALERGVRVYGAASMGALRAAELYPFGMVGCGRIFEWYKNGIITGDDEVALCHGPREEEYKNLSLPLVNVRATLEAATARGLISAAAAMEFLQLARAIYYPERNWAACLAAGKTAGLALTPELERFCLDTGVDQKRLDAQAVLQLVARRINRPTPVSTPAVRTARTCFLLELLGNDLSLLPGCGGQASPRLLREYGRLSGHFVEMEMAAQLDQLADTAGQLLHLEVTPEEIATEAQKFWAERHIHSAIAIRAWLSSNLCSSGHLQDLLRRRLLLRKLQSVSEMPLSYYYSDLLRQRGEFAAACRETAQKELSWNARKNFYQPEEFSPEEWQKLLNRARQALGPEAGELSLEEIAPRLGYKNILELLKQLLKEEVL